MANRIIRLKLGIADAFLVKGKQLVLVDTGIRVSPEKYRKVFAENNVNPRDIKFIIITHGHSDHFAHLAWLKKLTGAEIICHKKAATHLINGSVPPLKGRTLFGRALLKILTGKLTGYESVRPDIEIDNNTDLTDLGLDIKLLVTPGHSDCSLTIIADNDEVIIGDMLVPSLFMPQKPDLAVFVTDTGQLIQSLQAALKTDGRLFYGSHGGTFSRNSVEKMLLKYRRKIA